ncbi:hypothetical protein RAB80_017059 [Fusarium oxysporum f. sp. vasinfectum]|nr:hypothetical protein RAB80_017059 [Fusarium oxysporum f. sp. vasinfectum]
MSTYTDGYDHGNTMKEQLDNLKAYLNSAFNQISELDKIQEESLQSIVDEWHRLNEYSIVAVFDCVWTGLGRIKILMRRAQVIMSTINPQSLIEIHRLTLTVDEKGFLLHYDTHDRRLLIRVANSASSSARQNKETGELGIKNDISGGRQYYGKTWHYYKLSITVLDSPKLYWLLAFSNDLAYGSPDWFVK